MESSIALHQTVPDFTLPATGGTPFKLSDFLGQTVVVYFYPKDATPGCTTQGVQFRDLYPQFLQHNTVIIGISRDSIQSHENFKAKFSFPFELASDAHEVACHLFGVIKMKNMYGKQVRGIERSTFVMNAQGVLVQAWRGVKAEGHAQLVLDFVQTLS